MAHPKRRQSKTRTAKNITKALKMSNGNKAKAAKILNIPRTTLYYKIDQYKIDVSKIWHMTKFWQNDKL